MIREALTVLAVEQRATVSEIKKAYRDQVKRWHPDQFEDDPERSREAESRLREINRAYEILQSYNADPQKMGWYASTSVNHPKRTAFHASPPSQPPHPAWWRSRSTWIRTAFIGLAVLAISGIGYGLNRFVADDDDLSFAAAAVPAASAVKTEPVPAPVLAPDAPVAKTEVKTASPAIAIVPAVLAEPTVLAQADAPTVLAAVARVRRTGAAAGPPSFLDPDVPDMALGERLELRTECMNEAAAGGQDSYRDCFLAKLEEHPHPIHLAAGDDSSGQP